jgi:poly(A) polymerase
MSALLRAAPIPALARAFADAGHQLFLVGGCVRDELLDRPTHDLDLTTDARPPAIKRLIDRAGAHAQYAIGEKFGTIGGVFGDLIVEITTFRAEQYEPGSRKPAVEFGDSIHGDLSRRDFTINAMAMDVGSGELVDPFGGREDLAAGVIRAVGVAADRFAEDPLRLLRAVRFAAQLGFRIEASTEAAIREQAASLSLISRERVAQELNRMLLAEPPSGPIRALCDLGLMEHAVPEVMPMRGMWQGGYHHKDVYEHTLLVLDRTPPDLILRWAALLHDIAKPRTRSVQNGEIHFFAHETVGARMARRILSRLNMDRETIETVTLLVAMHLRANSYDADWTDGAVRRFMREAGESVDRLLVLSRADVTSQRPDKVRAAIRRVDELQHRIGEIRAQEDVAKITSPLDGLELMALFDRGPGPWIRPIKDRLLAAVIDGELAQDDKPGATELARQWAQDGGDTD